MLLIGLCWTEQVRRDGAIGEERPLAHTAFLGSAATREGARARCADPPQMHPSGQLRAAQDPPASSSQPAPTPEGPPQAANPPRMHPSGQLRAAQKPPASNSQPAPTPQSPPSSQPTPNPSFRPAARSAKTARVKQPTRPDPTKPSKQPAHPEPILQASCAQRKNRAPTRARTWNPRFRRPVLYRKRVRLTPCKSLFCRVFSCQFEQW